jgi:branched-chain amino acid transport system substrate-binding protein
MMLINNPWGESNEKGLTAAIAAAQIKTAGIEKFETSDVDMVPQLSRLKAAQADVILLVANVAPGAQVIKSLERLEWTVPVVSHWSICGGRFAELAGNRGPYVEFIQTYSFFGPQNLVGQRVLAAVQAKYAFISGSGAAFHCRFEGLPFADADSAGKAAGALSGARTAPAQPGRSAVGW